MILLEKSVKERDLVKINKMDYNIENLMKSSTIKISKEGENVNWESLQKMSGEDLLKYNVFIKGHKVDFFRGAICDGLFPFSPKYGIGHHYRNVGFTASNENSSAIDLINSAYGTSLAWNSEDELII